MREHDYLSDLIFPFYDALLEPLQRAPQSKRPLALARQEDLARLQSRDL